jgi:hypothetical protein
LTVCQWFDIKTTGTVYQWSDLKTTGTIFQWFGLKTIGTIFSGLASKPVVMVFSGLASKSVTIVSPSFTSKLVVIFLVEPQNKGGGGFFGLGLKTGSYDLMILISKSPRHFIGLGLKIKQASVCRLRLKTDGWR